MPTVKELKNICKQRNIIGYSTLNKAELLIKCQKKFKFVFEFVPLVYIINYDNEEDVQPKNWEQLYNYGQNLCETVIDWLNAKPDIFKGVTGKYNVRMSERKNIKTMLL